MILNRVGTVGELIDALSHFPREMLVEVDYEGFAKNWIGWVHVTSDYGDGPVVEIVIDEPRRFGNHSEDNECTNRRLKRTAGPTGRDQ